MSNQPTTQPTTQQKITDIVNIVVNDTIETPIAVLQARCAIESREVLTERLHASVSEVIKLQYQLREMSIVDWYEGQDPLRQHLHQVFERHREFFKAGSNGDNWLAIATKQSKEYNGFEQFNGMVEDTEGPYSFMYFQTTDDMVAVIDKMRLRDTNKLLCTPLYKSK
jgi:glutamine phosphoribosylpyrophosphate amidotransferase